MSCEIKKRKKGGGEAGVNALYFGGSQIEDRKTSRFLN